MHIIIAPTWLWVRAKKKGKNIKIFLIQKKCDNLPYGCEAKRQVFWGDYTLSKTQQQFF